MGAPDFANGAIFFDRDGVLNVDHGYVHAPEQFQWTPGAREAVRLVNGLGLLAIVVTNQSGIARGYYGPEDFERLTGWMRARLAEAGARLDAVYHCPHHPEAAVESLRTVCDCRKPMPGMILRAIEDFRLDPSRCLLIGDRQSDLAAAKAAGIAGRLFPGGNLLEFLKAQPELARD